MKIHASIHRICGKCRPIHRWKRVMIICSNPRHKQKQG